MYRPRPLDTENLTCDICGKPAKWYDRVFAERYVLGEALCDECEEAIYGYFRDLRAREEEWKQVEWDCDADFEEGNNEE